MNKPPAVSASVIRPLNGDVKSESKSVTLAPRYYDANMLVISDHRVGDQGNAVFLSPHLNYFSREETPTSPSSPTAVLPPRKRKYSADESDHHLQVDNHHRPHHHNRQQKYSHNTDLIMGNTCRQRRRTATVWKWRRKGRPSRLALVEVLQRWNVWKSFKTWRNPESNERPQWNTQRYVSGIFRLIFSFLLTISGSYYDCNLFA